MKPSIKAFAGIVFVAAGAFAVLAATQTLAGNDARDTTDRAQRTCVSAPLDDTKVIDDSTLLVYDDFRNGYKLDISGPCTTMNDMSHIGFEFNGSDQICRAHDAFILHSEFDEAPLKCIINGVQPLTRAEAEALDQG